MNKIRLFALPWFAVVLCAVAPGHHASAQTTIKSECDSPQVIVGAATKKPDGLHRRPKVAIVGERLIDNATDYSISLPVSYGVAIDAAICNGTVRLQRSTSDQVQLHVSLIRELPHGQTVGSGIKWVRKPHPKISFVVDIEKRFQPMIVISVPLKSSVSMVLHSGSLSVESLPGDLSAEVSHGNLTLHLKDMDVDEYTVSVPHGLITGAAAPHHLWSGHKSGSFRLAVVVDDGNLILN